MAANDNRGGGQFYWRSGSGNVAGRVTRKMAPVLRRLYDQMPDPKWVISMGDCASCSGVFNNYALVQGVDEVVPVDVLNLYWDGLPEPKYVLAMGACASGGGPFKEGYNVVSGIDAYVPVDVYVAGCPPRPEALIHGVLTLDEKVRNEKLTTWK